MPIRYKLIVQIYVIMYISVASHGTVGKIVSYALEFLLPFVIQYTVDLACDPRNRICFEIVIRK